jgi:hypothetical protein
VSKGKKVYPMVILADGYFERGEADFQGATTTTI